MAAERSSHGSHNWTEELLAQDQANGEGEGEADAPKVLSEEVVYPVVERRLRSWYYQWVRGLII